MKKKLSWKAVLALVSACCAIVLATIALFPASRITKANYDRIEIGMSLAEVESILGAPTYPDRDGKAKYIRHYWHGNDGDYIDITFDESRRVCDTSYRNDAGPPEGYLRKLFYDTFPQFRSRCIQTVEP